MSRSSAAAQERLLAYAECEEAMEIYDRGLGFDHARNVLHRHGWHMQENPRRFTELLRKEALALAALQRVGSQDYVRDASAVPPEGQLVCDPQKWGTAVAPMLAEVLPAAAMKVALPVVPRLYEASPLQKRTRSG